MKEYLKFLESKLPTARQSGADDPFAGIGSVPYQALKMERRGWGCELNETYWKTSLGYAERAVANESVPTLFDLAEFTLGEEEAA